VRRQALEVTAASVVIGIVATAVVFFV